MDRVEKAFLAVPRERFLPEDVRGDAAIDSALPIGFGQTNSQPTTVGMMLRWLNPLDGNSVLDIGSGSGWTAALLAYLVRPAGKVYAVERIAQLVEFGKSNCRKLGIKNTHFYRAGQAIGLPEHAPYDRILVSAAAKKIPVELPRQLKDSGKLVIPVGSDILEIEKAPGGSLVKRIHGGFAFVPLIV